jgi:hypothetical protein
MAEEEADFTVAAEASAVAGFMGVVVVVTTWVAAATAAGTATVDIEAAMAAAVRMGIAGPAGTAATDAAVDTVLDATALGRTGADLARRRGPELRTASGTPSVAHAGQEARLLRGDSQAIAREARVTTPR